MTTHTKDILKSFTENGIRETKTRKGILELLEKSKSPISAGEILEKLKKTSPSLNKTTVYREIDFLLSANILTEVDFGDRKKRYELAHLDHHHHLVCTECKTVEDIHLEDHLEKEEERILNEKGFKILNHSLEFFGVCKKCQ